MKFLPLLLAVLGAAACSNAQQLPTVDELLARITAYAQQYRQSVPSFEADESAVSQQVKDGQVKWEVHLEMTLRELRDESDPSEFDDHYTFRMVDGKPPKKRFKLPYFVNGVFDNAIGFAGRSQDSCYEYRVSPGRDGSTVQLELWQKKQNPQPPLCSDVFEDYRKTVLVDAASGRILHVTRSMSPQAAHDHHEVVFVSVDYALQKLGDATFWLPVRFESHDEKNERRMFATYSSFHRYTSTAKMVESDPLPEVTQ
jgi:hypothetical protein